MATPKMDINADEDNKGGELLAYKFTTDVEKEYDSSKYVTDFDNFVDVLKKYGVAVIHGVLNDQEIEEMKDGMWKYLEHITSKFETPIDRNNKETWSEIFKLLPLHSFLMQHWGMGHAQVCWTLRQNPKIIKYFEKLWGTDDLLVSFDGASFHMPPEITDMGSYKNNVWYHTDQRLSDSEFRCIQSWVTAFDVNPGDATLTILEGSHNLHAEFAKAFGKTNMNSDWYKYSNEQVKWFLDRGCEIKSITCPVGSLVMWDSRLGHCGKESLPDRAKPNFRCVIYLCYTPRAFSTPELLQIKRNAFTQKRTTSHWPHRPKLFPVLPRAKGQTIPNIVDIPDPVLTPLGLKLAGFD